MEITHGSSGGGGGTPGGDDTEVQFNDAGSFGGEPEFTYDKTTATLTVPTLHGLSGSNLEIRSIDTSITVDAPSIIVRSSSVLGLSNNDGSAIAYLETTGQTQDRTFSFPDADGTIALTSDIPSLQTDGVANGSQTLLNLAAGANITLTDNGTGTVTIDAPGGGATAGQATVDFGAVTQEDSIARVTVANAAALSSSIINVSPAGIATADHDPDDYQWDNISGYVTNIVDGVSFDIIGVAPNGAFGDYAFNYAIN